MDMKENLKEVLMMGLGALSLTGEKANEIKEELMQKGEELYKQGAIKNEELKREIKAKIKEKTTANLSKEDLADLVSKLSDEDKKEITELLKKKSSKSEDKKEDK